MTVARTARRRRKQAVGRFRHMALVGRGNNNRSVYASHTVETYDKREAQAREKRAMLAARKSRRK
jgi:hypothetical protein